MRDAFGGVFMIRLFLVFIVIFVAFAAVSLNYAKAFRIKNKIIDLVEENEIIDLASLSKDEFRTQLDGILNSSNYYKTCKNEKIVSESGETIGYCYRGIVIKQSEKEKIEGTSSYMLKYNIYTYADWNLGSLNMLLSLSGSSSTSERFVDGTWEIQGQAKVVKRG